MLDLFKFCKKGPEKRKKAKKARKCLVLLRNYIGKHPLHWVGAY
jgi:hypothetical protein